MEMVASTIREALELHALDLADQVWGKRPASPFESVPDIDGRPWYIIETEPQREGTASAHMVGRGFDPYLPMVLYRGVRAGRGVRDVERPMFRGYLFLKMLFAVDYDRIRNLPGVRGVLRKAGDNNWEGPFANPSESDIDFIRSQEKEALDPKAFLAEKLAPYKEGRRVRILEGAFGGFTGKVWKLADNERITLLLDVFARRTPVEVDSSQIEPL